ncbi:MAG: hypothetical protein IJ151_01880 [Bacteroidales bacterium]|nr:hypothetical protein [Bacteroidales bacterium]
MNNNFDPNQQQAPQQPQYSQPQYQQPQYQQPQYQQPAQPQAPQQAPQQPQAPQYQQPVQRPQAPQYQQPVQPQRPQAPQYQQPVQPQYQQAPQYRPQPAQYQQPAPVAPKAKGSDGAILTFAIIFFVTTGLMTLIQYVFSYSKTITIVYGVLAIIQSLSLILVPLGIKKSGTKAFAFILIALVVIWLVLQNLSFFGIRIF